MAEGKGSGGSGGQGEPFGEVSVRAVPAEALIEERAEDEAVVEEAELVEALEARVLELEGEVAALEVALVEADRAHEMERVLGEADAVDLETARLLTEMAVASMEEPDVLVAVEELRRSKPFLFRRKARGGFYGGAMASRVDGAGRSAGLGGLADDARESGDRRDLLAYLRERRG